MNESQAQKRGFYIFIKWIHNSAAEQEFRAPNMDLGSNEAANQLTFSRHSRGCLWDQDAAENGRAESLHSEFGEALALHIYNCCSDASQQRIGVRMRLSS
jgi:hypothetical protein